MWSVFIETAEIKENVEKLQSTLFLYCNGRSRKQPVIPATFFGNVVLALSITRKLEDLSQANIFTTAQKVREKVSSVNDDYVQSYIDYATTNENCQMALPQKYDFIVTNWDHFLDWYADANLGKGKPKKFTTVNQSLNRLCFVLPDGNGGIEAIIGLERPQMERFQQHPSIKQFFKF